MSPTSRSASRLPACRRLAEGDRFVRAGRWSAGRLPLGRKLTGMRAGIIGLGRIGIEVARRLEAFKCDIRYVDPAPRDVAYRAYPDAVALARGVRHPVPLRRRRAEGSRASRSSIGRSSRRSGRAAFSSTSRAAGWSTRPALTEALATGRLGAAGLDVFHDEPNVPAPLAALDNVVLTPHVASSTEETAKAMGDCVVDNLVSWFEGRGALTPVT